MNAFATPWLFLKFRMGIEGDDGIQFAWIKMLNQCADSLRATLQEHAFLRSDILLLGADPFPASHTTTIQLEEFLCEVQHDDMVKVLDDHARYVGLVVVDGFVNPDILRAVAKDLCTIDRKDWETTNVFQRHSGLLKSLEPRYEGIMKLQERGAEENLRRLSIQWLDKKLRATLKGNLLSCEDISQLLLTIQNFPDEKRKRWSQAQQVGELRRGPRALMYCGMEANLLAKAAMVFAILEGHRNQPGGECREDGREREPSHSPQKRRKIERKALETSMHQTLDSDGFRSFVVDTIVAHMRAQGRQTLEDDEVLALTSEKPS